MTPSIAIRMEGGIGDHLLSNRFVHAVKEKHPNSPLSIYCDAHNNQATVDLMKAIWPSVYQNAELVPQKSKEFKIKTIFNDDENYTAAIENLPQETIDKMMKSDVAYDLSLDSLNWMFYDFDWFRYFYFYPKPEVVPQYSFNLPDKFVLMNMYSRPDAPHPMEPWYLISVVREMAKVTPIVITTMAENRWFYKEVEGIENVTILETDLLQTFYLASKCSAFLGIDSGIRCMPYYFGTPVYFFSPYCSSFGNIAFVHSHIRWSGLHLSPIPFYLDVKTVVSLLENSIKHPACKLFPQIMHDKIEHFIIRRKYDEQKTFRKDKLPNLVVPLDYP